MKATRPENGRSMTISKKRLAEIAAIPDEEIDTSEIPEVTEDFFRGARLVLPADDPVEKPSEEGGS